ncbi:MAG TPA: hypothetical protein VJ521_09930, partial [Acidobacteriota bacterium]|nr:hypothetical protein [Acidobacteriota bacterium]
MKRRIVWSIFILLVWSLSVYAEEWYDAYDEGVKAVSARDWATAEAKLTAAKATGPKPGKRVRTYGTRFIVFIPDYYLGIVYFNQGKLELAAQKFDLVEQSGVLSRSDAQYAQMAKMRQSMKPAEPSIVPPEPPKESPVAIAQREAEQILRQAEDFLNKGELEAAKNEVQRAKQKDSANQKANELASRIAKMENDFRRLVDQAQSRSDIDAAQKSLRAAQQKDPRNRLYADLLNQLAGRPAEEPPVVLDAKVDQQQEKLAQFKKLMDRAERALAENRFAEARSLATDAAKTGVDDKKTAQSLLRSIAIAEIISRFEKARVRKDPTEAERAYKELASIDPQSSNLQKMRDWIDAVSSNLSAAEKEQTALLAFL